MHIHTPTAAKRLASDPSSGCIPSEEGIYAHWRRSYLYLFVPMRKAPPACVQQVDLIVFILKLAWFHMRFKRPEHRWRSGFILVLCLMINMGALSQVDSLFIAPFKEKKSLTYGLNNRRTFFLNQSTTIYGAYMGIQYGERMKHVITINSNPFWIDEEDHVHLIYAGFAEEFTFLFVKRFEFISYIHAGLGFATYQTMTLPGEYETNRELVSPIELGVHTSYKVLDWLKLKGGVGYRIVLLDEINELNNVYFKIGLGVDIRELRYAMGSKNE